MAVGGRWVLALCSSAPDRLRSGDGARRRRRGDDPAEVFEAFGDARKLVTLTARVEIVNSSNSSSASTSATCASASSSPRSRAENILWSVDRDTPGKQVQEFFLACDELHRG